MSYSQYLKELLRPLGVYDLEAVFNGSELESAGMALDGVEQELEELWRESSPVTAESWGLDKLASLFSLRPAVEEPGLLGQALTALMAIGGDSFTCEAMNSAVAGCGVNARIVDTGAEQVRVFFPDIAGVPAQFDRIRGIIEDILPPQVSISYQFDTLTWSELEQRFASWKAIEERGLTWDKLEASK